MDSCHVLIVGGGPAGSSCAWQLQRSGLDVLILDKRRFPRDKVCGGWVTPAVMQELELDPREYGCERVLQPITGFLTGLMGDGEVETDYGRPVSYGIRRFEFDHYLLQRSGVRVLEGETLAHMERSGEDWIVNGRIKTPLVIGAGGHFCPVARLQGAKLSKELIVAAQEVEFAMDTGQQAQCTIRPEVPELFFCPDMKGYGWCFRKESFLNIGLGRLDKHELSEHVSSFVNFLKARRKIPLEIPSNLHGHAYLLYGTSARNLVGDGILLIGDAAGLAYARSGEGIRPAVESGLLAAKAILAADGEYRRGNLQNYAALLTKRFGLAEKDWSTAISRRIPSWLTCAIGGKLLATRWFSRHVLLDRWFLHAHKPALQVDCGLKARKPGVEVQDPKAAIHYQ